MDYKIAIPSYKRPETIKSKTLELLSKYNIDKQTITIFVANKEEEKVYSKSLKGEYKIVVGVPTIGKQRNFIEQYYSEGTKLMMFDDDLDGIFIKNKNKLKEIENLNDDFIYKGFELCKQYKINIFGLYAAANPFFMKKRIYTKLCYIPGGVFGIVVNHDPFLERVTNHGEDYEYSIRQYIKNKALIRFDYLTIKSKFFKEAGGLQTIRTKEYIYNSIYQIQSMFPQYCKMYIRKSTGNAELRLKDTR
tara:strand:+ start:492 stop:1235 length:744 start_codon:yes stop_codon:yes gene_type:complete